MNIELLQKHGKVRKFAKAELICKENEQGSIAFLLLQGKADVVLGSFKDKQRVVATLNPGAVFGEMSLLEGKPRTATVIAASDVMVLEIAKDNFLEILQADSEIAYQIFLSLYQRAEKCLEEMKNSNIAYLVRFRQNEMYTKIKNLSQEQFRDIVEKNGEYALSLLSFLSHGLAQIDEELVREHRK